MKTNKLNSKSITEGTAFAVGAVGGSMASRILAEKIPMENVKLKRGILAAVGILGTAMINGNDTTGKVVQGAAAGVVATQIVALLKDIINPTEGLMKTALGTPENPIVIYSGGYNNIETLDNPYADEPRFLALPEQFASV